MHFIYGAPFKIALAGVYLYKLLDSVRDKHTGTLDGLLGTMEFIKFFPWEERLTQRTMNARKREPLWLVKSRINSILFSAIWALAPILVSVVSSASYIRLGNQFTVRCTSSFAIVRAPLNLIPTWIVFMMETKVVLDRIQGYTDKDGVDGQVSSFKEDTEGRGNKEGLGTIKGSFKWNEVEEKDGKGKAPGSSVSNTESDAASTHHQLSSTMSQKHSQEPFKIC